MKTRGTSASKGRVCCFGEEVICNSLMGGLLGVKVGFFRHEDTGILA
jgi:hypothetical protein